MSDIDTVFQVNREIRDDPNKPVYTGPVDLQDEVSCELALYEADEITDTYLERFRPRFKDPDLFEGFCMAYRVKFRGEVRKFIEEARQTQEATKRDTAWGADGGYESGDDDGNV